MVKLDTQWTFEKNGQDWRIEDILLITMVGAVSGLSHQL